MSPILGLGIDIVEIDRIRKGIEEHGFRFTERLFTEEERAYCDAHVDPSPHYAGRFAAKEAIVKALGVGFGKEVSWQDIKILNDEKGKPHVYFSPAFLARLAAPSFLISISHEKNYVVATALWIYTS
ncbi:MAG TPA: holo-[acyl-carrier-protein] synthase [Parachlamydiales bacterium]|nr:MAG: holo-[acyl-carrier-protein] synthase [Chlamydiae bacterium GWA2_50_15]OGN54564.1 MAG: holo-[acyl-carrier-protein] synthase [Chlamydiae bacterium GWF2_49_8]OGN67807.1 MAG: holo-[acyl-carrier-protein] synthase [Chlamydiae bacterium RIFCSPLOWO2_02_FULL_49_12]OGN70322.1 MAG: holo-[acyl-carrier-protein] synthase [Chlamydiae bacterium RIFCSPLOWO2_12_FULL_49_12]HAZ15606.1 holo-[acyl-carrier-protein] synthase [Parachlamydiales bacterium]